MTTRVVVDWRWILAAAVGTLVLLCGGEARAQVEVTAEVTSTRVYVGEQFRLQVRVNGSRSPSPPRVPAVPGLEIRAQGGQDVSQSSTIIINGRRTEERFEGYVYVFDAVAGRPGALTIPEIELDVAGQTYRTKPIQITAVTPTADSDVKLWVEVDPPQAYVGEPVKLRVTLGLARDASGVSITVPGIEGAFELVPVQAIPRTNLFQRSQNALQLLGDEVPTEQGTRTIDGGQLAVFSAERTIIPRQAGTLTIGPATVMCELVLQQARSFFESARTRRVAVPSEPIELIVKPLPAQGRPANFNGLIGKYDISVKARPTEISVGDPIEVEIRVSGPLVDTVPAPALDRQPGLSGAFRVAEESSPPTVRGDFKTFQRTFRVLSPEVTEIPPLELPYFDTDSGRYEIARSKPVPLTVKAARVVTSAEAVGASLDQGGTGAATSTIEDLAGGLRHNYDGPRVLADQSFDLKSALASPAGLAAIALPPAAYGAAALGVFLRRRNDRNSGRRRRRSALSRAQAAIGDAARLEGGAAAASVGAALRNYLADRLERPETGLTTRECVALVSQAASPQVAERIRGLLERSDAAAYGGAAPEAAQRLVQEAAEALGAIERELGGRS